MNWLEFKRVRQALSYGWQDSKKISKETGKSRWLCYKEYLSCFRKYFVFSNQYFKEKLYLLPEQDLEVSAKNIGAINHNHDKWVIDSYENRKFIEKWSSLKWERTPKGTLKRKLAYTKPFNTGTGLQVQRNVDIHREHFLWGTITIGNNVLFAKNVFIDYSGDLIIHDDVALANGVIIETHTHLLEKKGAPPAPGRLEIEKGVKILSRAYIADTCHFIGRYARIGAGTYIRGNVLPYAIMIGNPAKIVGFMYSPEEVEEFEKNVFPEEERIDLEKYRQDYKKYFIDRRKEIKGFLQK